MSDDVMVFNEGAELRSKTTAGGKTRFHIKIKAEPIVIDTRKDVIAGPVADAIAHHLRERVRGISAVVSKGTQKAREAAARAVERGEAWAMKRYGGGRIGTMQPNQSNRKFNDSGRFAESLVANADNDGNWRVNVAGNRLNADTVSGGAAGVERIWQELVRLVPEFGNTSLLLESDVVRASIKQASKDMLRKANATTGKLQLGVVRSLFNIARQVDRIASGG